MGMWGYYYRMGEATLADVRKNPALLSVGDETPKGIDTITVEKTWDALAYLLSKSYRDWMNGEGDAEDFSPDLMLAAVKGAGGEEITYQDCTYLVLEPDTVSDIATALESIGLPQLKANYDPELMDEAAIYPEIWTRDGDEALEDYVYPYFVILKDFYREAAKQKQYVLSYAG